MEVIGRGRLDGFARKHPDVSSALDAWACEVRSAKWSAPRDIKTRYPSASLLADNRVVFNIKGNKYRLDVKVAYQTGKVLIKRIGTHAEYDKWEF